MHCELTSVLVNFTSTDSFRVNMASVSERKKPYLWRSDLTL